MTIYTDRDMRLKQSVRAARDWIENEPLPELEKERREERVHKFAGELLGKMSDIKRASIEAFALGRLSLIAEQREG